MKRANLNARDLAIALSEPPGTTSGRLNGWLPLNEDQVSIIMDRIKTAERVENHA